MGRGASELGVLSQAWNSARSLALSRLQQEARLAGADAVVGVHIKWGAHDFAHQLRRDGRHGHRRADRTCGAHRSNRCSPTCPARTSGSCSRPGYRPVGVVGATTIFYVVSAMVDPTAHDEPGCPGGPPGSCPTSPRLSTLPARWRSGISAAPGTDPGGARDRRRVHRPVESAAGRVDTGNDTKRIDLIVTLHVPRDRHCGGA